MLTGRIHGIPRFSAQFVVRGPDDVLLFGWGNAADASARRETINDRGPAKGPFSVASRILRGAASGRIYEAPLNQEHTA